MILKFVASNIVSQLAWHDHCFCPRPKFVVMSPVLPSQNCQKCNNHQQKVQDKVTAQQIASTAVTLPINTKVEANTYIHV